MTNLGYELTHGSQEFSNYWHPVGPLGCVDYLHAHREYSWKMLERAKKYSLLDKIEVPVLIPEDIIGLKIQSIVNNPNRHSKDMADIEYLLREKLNELDLGLVREYFELFNLQQELDELLKRIKSAQ